MDFPAGGIIDKIGYTQKDHDIENFLIGVELDEEDGI